MQAHSSDQIRRPGHALNLTSHSAGWDRRTRSEDSWVEISSQPSSSSLSSTADDVVPAGFHVPANPRGKRRRARHNVPSGLNMSHRPTSAGAISSQEEYEESENESDRVMASSGEIPVVPQRLVNRLNLSPALQSTASDDSVPQITSSDDENKTAINYPIRNEQVFTPQPNAFSRPPTSGQMRATSAAGSYFPTQRRNSRPNTRHSFPTQTSQVPQNVLSPGLNPTNQHEEALRASLSTLQSFAAAARNLQKPEAKQRPTCQQQTRSNNRPAPMTLHLVPESAMHATSPPHDPAFPPTIRRTTTTETSTSSQVSVHPPSIQHSKRPRRATSREHRAVKKARRAASSGSSDVVSPTLMTWVISAGVVVVLSAISFRAGYAVGKEAGRLETGGRSCAREVGGRGAGLRLGRSIAV